MVSVLLILLTAIPSKNLQNRQGFYKNIIQELLGFPHFYVNQKHIENHSPYNSN